MTTELRDRQRLATLMVAPPERFTLEIAREIQDLKLRVYAWDTAKRREAQRNNETGGTTP